MKVASAFVLAALSLSTARASGLVGVYALIDKVVMEPNADNPERIRIFGVFSIMTNLSEVFQPAQRGYLFFTFSSDDKDLIRREWADLKAAAGTHTVIAFGGWSFRGPFFAPRVRKTDDKPEGPDPYILGAGLSRVRSNTDYAPIKSLLEYR
jgi:hypothetical protein